jgi:hypothetical protein
MGWSYREQATEQECLNGVLVNQLVRKRGGCAIEAKTQVSNTGCVPGLMNRAWL